MIYATLYVLVVVAANYTAMWFVPLPVFGAVSVGTILFGATFTLRDYMHASGRGVVYGAIAMAVVLSTALSVWFEVEWRIVVASAIAIVISEAADTEIYQALRLRSWWMRVSSSNAVSVPLDTLLFNGLAFWGVLSPSFWLSVVIGETIVKYLVGLAVGAARWQIRRNLSK